MPFWANFLFLFCSFFKENSNLDSRRGLKEEKFALKLLEIAINQGKIDWEGLRVNF